jgi:glutamate synthase (NADPH/NADH)
VIGGGDTGNDCLGTSMRHGAVSVLNFEVMPQAPLVRAANNPWPQWSRTFKTDYGHEEVGTAHGQDPRIYSILSKKFHGKDGQVVGVDTVKVEFVNGKMEEVPGSEQYYECDLVFLAMGFLGPEAPLIKELDLPTDARSNISAPFGPKGHQASGKVFAAGDCRRGQSLVVWAIREGRECAREVDTFLMGASNLS